LKKIKHEEKKDASEEDEDDTLKNYKSDFDVRELFTKDLMTDQMLKNNNQE
jgi:hypothetical protein